MASADTSDIDKLALEFLRLLHDTIPWREVPDEVRRDKWRVLAKRLMASGGEDLQEFLHNVVRAVAGDAFYVKRNVGEEGERVLGKELDDLLNKVQDKELQKKLIAYIKARAIPLVIRLSAILPEREEEGE
jgi:hypothetical protein